MSSNGAIQRYDGYTVLGGAIATVGGFLLSVHIGGVVGWIALALVCALWAAYDTNRTMDTER